MSNANTPPSAVILGASGGIGSALARELAAAGWRLCLAGRNETRLAELAKSLDADSYTLDATSTDEVDACVAAAHEQYGKIDGVANCVGSLLLKPAHLTSDVEWDATIAVNLRSAFAAVRAAARGMLRSGGSIVLCSTAASLTGLPNHEAIAAAKGGVNGLVRAAAATYAPRGIRVNAVAPGLTRTPLSARLIANERAFERSRAMHALGRIGEPEDIAAAMAWLLEPANSWVTGQILAVDGGLSTLRPAASA